MTTDNDPEAGRPHMPGYGIETSGEGLLPWRWAEERLVASHNYWLATARPDGAPHVMPVWGVWLDGRLYFSTGGESRKARNLAADPRCAVTTEGAEEAVVVEGEASEVPEVKALTRFKEAYDRKYDWDIDVSEGGIYAVTPKVAFAFIEKPTEFARTATRWRFG